MDTEVYNKNFIGCVHPAIVLGTWAHRVIWPGHSTQEIYDEIRKLVDHFEADAGTKDTGRLCSVFMSSCGARNPEINIDFNPNGMDVWNARTGNYIGTIHGAVFLESDHNKLQEWMTEVGYGHERCFECGKWFNRHQEMTQKDLGRVVCNECEPMFERRERAKRCHGFNSLGE